MILVPIPKIDTLNVGEADLGLEIVEVGTEIGRRDPDRDLAVEGIGRGQGTRNRKKKKRRRIPRKIRSERKEVYLP